ncbi:hypothetical protein [Paenibacillus polymyxa]|uniref:hypothetical protein n=1 Tax=Paenibacillus polymyxa TaxID=1406 RepID=UPI0032170DC9
MRNWKYSEHDGKYIINDEQGVLVAMVCDAMHAELIVRQHQQLAERDRTIDQLNVAIEMHKDNVHDWNRTIDKMVVEAAGLRKALEEIASEEMLIGSTPVKMHHIARKALGRE